MKVTSDSGCSIPGEKIFVPIPTVHFRFISTSDPITTIHSLPYNAHTNDYFKWNKILKVHDLYKLNICSLFYRYTQPSVDLPSAVRLQTISSIHTYNTRHNHNLLTPRYNLTKSQSSFLYNSTHAWNSIPLVIQNCNSLKFVCIGPPLLCTPLICLPGYIVQVGRDRGKSSILPLPYKHSW